MGTDFQNCSAMLSILFAYFSPTFWQSTAVAIANRPVAIFKSSCVCRGVFPLSSKRSRAAVRALLNERQSAYERREVIISNRSECPHASEWQFDVKEHTAGRVVSIPAGMALEQGLRALGDFSDRELARAAELHPEPLQMGTMLMLRR